MLISLGRGSRSGHFANAAAGMYESMRPKATATGGTALEQSDTKAAPRFRLKGG